jgi:hypothetical protein
LLEDWLSTSMWAPVSWFSLSASIRLQGPAHVSSLPPPFFVVWFEEANAMSSKLGKKIGSCTTTHVKSHRH